MAEVMTAAGEGDFENLARAGADCELNIGPAPAKRP